MKIKNIYCNPLKNHAKRNNKEARSKLTWNSERHSYNVKEGRKEELEEQKPEETNKTENTQ